MTDSRSLRMGMTLTLGEWRDSEGDPMGEWLPIDQERYYALIDEAGGLDALTVFSTLTDPEGVYGPPTIYTAWGKPDDDVPFVSATRSPGELEGCTYAAFSRFPTERTQDDS